MLASRSALFAGVLSAGILGVTGAKKVNYDFTSGSLPSGVTVSRNQSAGYINSSGVYAYAAADTARFDHTSAGVMRGLMIEPMTSNLMQQSRTLTTSPWVNSAVNVTGGYASYDGTMTVNASTGANAWSSSPAGTVNYMGLTVALTTVATHVTSTVYDVS